MKHGIHGASTPVLPALVLGFVTLGAVLLGSQSSHAMDVAVTHSVDNLRVTAGNNATFSLVVTNSGPETATDVRVLDQLSSRSTFISAVSSQGSCGHTNGLVTCSLGSLISGERVTIAVVARIGSGTNTAQARVVANEVDPVLENNTASQSPVGVTILSPYANPETIILPLLDPGPGSVYPDNVFVSGRTAAVFKVTVTLHNVSHDFPDDMDVLLVGPRGQKVLLMSDVGLDNALADVTLTFDDEASATLPDTDPAFGSGTYRPSNYGVFTDAFSAPAPAGPYVTNLSVFRGTDPNGTWSLYVMDDQPENATPNSLEGLIADGWSLNITTGDPLADLRLTMTGQPDAVVVGNHLFYSINVTNRGPASSMALVQDTLPLGMVLVSATATRGGCVESGGTITCDLGNLSSGEGGRVVLEVAPTLGGVLTNRVVVIGNQLDLTASDNVASIATTVIPVADLRLSMADVPPESLLGQPITYSFSVTNAGPNTATSVSITNLLPAGAMFVSAGASQGGCTNLGTSVLCAAGDLAAGANAAFAIVAKTTLTGVNSNYLSVAAAELDFTPTNNGSATVVTVLPAADLSVTAANPMSQVPLGQNYVVAWAVSNRGPSAVNAVLVNTLPESTTLVSVQSSRGACSNVTGVIRCDFGTMASGEFDMVTVTARTTVVGTLTNTASINGPLSDPDSANNSVTLTAVVVPAADLVLAMVDSPDPLWLGDTMSYILSVTNLGPLPATTVTLTNQLPPGVGFLSAVPSQGACSRLGDEISCELGTMAVGATASIVISFQPTFLGLVTNRATVACELLDPNPGDNRRTEISRFVTSSGRFANAAPISIPSLGSASPYPSTIFVSALTASVFSVRVTLTNLTHTYPDDLDFMLVGPNGRAVMLMSDCGGESAVNNLTLTFDDGAPNGLPNSGLLTSGLFRPTSFDPSPDIFPLPAPSLTPDTNLAVFAGIDPNGPWSLFILDDADKDSGVVANGWSLELVTLDPIADLVLASVLPPSLMGVSSNAVFTYSITNRGPANAVNARFTNQVPSQVQAVFTTASQGSCTFTEGRVICGLGDIPVGGVVTVVVSGKVSSAGHSTNRVNVTSAPLDLRPTNNVSITEFLSENPPVITLHPTNQLVMNGTLASIIAGAVGDPPLALQWQRNGVNVPGGTNASLTFDPIKSSNAGVYRLRALNRVGVAFSSNATVIVFGPPSISDLADQVIDEDTSTELIHFTVEDFESPAEALTLFAESSDLSIVPLSGIALNGLGTNRTLRITPLPDRFGVVTITIGVRDPEGGVSTQTFSLTVRAVNDLPGISDIAAQLTDEDTPVVVGFGVADLETAPDLLLYTVTSSNLELVSPTNVVFLGDGTNRTATITPASHQSGSTLLTLTITDEGGATASDTFLFNVASANDAPTLAPLAELNLIEDSGLRTVILEGITSGAPNENQHLVVTAKSSHPAVIPDPTVVYSNPDSTGSLAFAPLTNAHGVVVITVTVKDGQATNQSFSRSFTVTVAPTNDVPVLGAVPDQVMAEDGEISLPIVIVDPDDTTESLTLVASSSNSDLVPNEGLAFSNTGELRSLRIVPLSNRFGITTLTLTLSDTNGASVTNAFLVTVNPINDAPTLDPIVDLSLSEDAPLQNVLLTGISPGAFNEIEPVALSAVAANPALFSSLTVDHTNSSSTAVLSFRLAANATGTSAITVRVDDGQATNHSTTRTFTVTVTGTNDLPTISTIDDQSGVEDTTLEIPFTINDAETPPLTLSLTASSTNTSLVANTNIQFNGSGSQRTLIVRPSTNQFGTTLITVRLSDGAVTNSESFVLTISPVNDAPTLNVIGHFQTNSASGNPVYTITLSGITSGAPNENATFSFTTASTNSLLVPAPTVTHSGTNLTGTLTLRPANNSGGITLITVTVNDGGTTNNTFSRSFLVFIKSSANALPTVSIIGNQTITEDTSTGVLPFNARDVETSSLILSVLATSSNQRLIPDQNIFLTMGANGTNRGINISPAPNQTGTADISLTVVDGAFGSSNMTFNVTVNATNDAPTMTSVANQTIAENTSTGVLSFNVDDVDSVVGGLQVSASSDNQALLPNANIVVGGSGSSRGLVATPLANQSGSATVTLRVSDGLSTNATSFILTVEAHNEPPTITPVADVSVPEDSAVPPVAFSVADIETTADALAVFVVSSNPGLAPTNRMVLEGTGADRTLTLSPEANQHGNALITLVVTDGTASSSNSFLLTVSPVNDRPTLNPIADALINESSGTYTVILEGIGPGPGDQNQSVALFATSSDLSIVPPPSVSYQSSGGSGSLSFIPIPNTNGVVTISVTVSDGQADDAFLTRSFAVTINAAPKIADISDQFGSEDTVTAPIAVAVSDRDTPIELVTLTARSLNPTLVAAEGIRLEGTGEIRSLFIQPTTNQFGTALIELRAGDTNGAFTTNLFVLHVEPVVDPIVILTQPGSLMTVIGATATFNVTADSGLSLSYQWQRDGIDLPDETSGTVSLANVQLTDASRLRVLISNADTSLMSEEAQLEVVGTPPAPAIVSVTQDGTTVAIKFHSVLGLNYTLEYKNSFSLSEWTELSVVPGNGSIATIADSMRFEPVRFYRLRVN